MVSNLTVPGVGEQGRPVEQRSVHFDLSHLDGAPEYTLHACLEEHPLQRHTPETLEQARAATPLLRAIPDERLTHFAELELPSDAVALLSVTAAEPDGGHRLATMAIHTPKQAYRDEQQLASSIERVGRPSVHPKLQALGIDAAALREATGSSDPAPYPPDIDDYHEATDAAVAFLVHHRDVMNLIPSAGNGAAYVIQKYLEANPNLSDLAITILQLGNAWMTKAPVLDEQGHQMHGEDGKPLWTHKVDPTVTAAATGPLQWAIRQIKNDANLEGTQWNVQQGLTATDYGATQQTDAELPIDAPFARPFDEVARFAPDSGTGFNWTMQNLSPSSGFTVNDKVKYEPPATTGAWAGTGFWSQPSSDGGKTWPYAAQLLAGEVYLKITTPDHPQGLVKAKLVPGTTGDGGTPFTVDLSAVGAQSKATLSLNAMETTLSYSLSLKGSALTSTAGASFCDASGKDYEPVPLTDYAGYGTLTIEVTNHWLRHLSAYVQFLDDAGNAITPKNWDEVLPGFIRSIFQPDDTKKYVGLISPVQTICGIPLPAEATTLTIPIPNEAATVRLLCGGLGTGKFDSGVCGIGITGTVVGELALPIIFLIAGAAISNSKPVIALMEDKELLFAVCAIAGFLATAGLATEIAVQKDARPALVQVANALGPLLLKTGLKWFIAKAFAQGTAERALPFVDVAFAVFNAAVTAAQVAQTTIEVLLSPFVYETRVTRSIDVKVTLTPDQRTHQFPPVSAGGHYVVNVVYDNNATYGVVTNKLPDTISSDPITVTLKNCPAGGQLQVRSFFYAPNGWQAGQGSSGWLPALATDGTTLVIPDLMITTNDVPLSAASHYQHTQKIVYEGSKHDWSGTKQAPTTTLTTPSPYFPKQISNWTGITLAQGPAQVAYSYEATGLDPNTPSSLYTVENLSILQDPESEYSVPKKPVGFAGKATPVYELVSPDDGSGPNFWLDPSAGAWDPVTNPGGGLHLRRLTVGYKKPPPAFAAANDESWGRFVLSGDRFAIHPKGYVVGISFQTAKLQILPIPPAATEDRSAPIATLAGGQGSREGLMSGPAALGVALDGRILVLEALNRRIQAFTVDGTPVPCFGDPKNPSATMALLRGDGETYLDMSVEAKGYIYVLGHAGDGSSPASYFVDVYQPNGEWLVRTTGVAAAKIVVDLMRSLYTLNYEIILGASERPEPSVSMWLPAPPEEGP